SKNPHQSMMRVLISQSSSIIHRGGGAVEWWVVVPGSMDVRAGASIQGGLGLPAPFGRYLLLKHLSRGGMGDVYLAVTGQKGFERLCVVKKVRREFASIGEFVSRFLDEGRTLTALSHGNIAQVIEV